MQASLDGHEAPIDQPGVKAADLAPLALRHSHPLRRAGPCQVSGGRGVEGGERYSSTVPADVMHLMDLNRVGSYRCRMRGVTGG